MVWKEEYTRSIIGGVLMIGLAWLFTPIFVYIFISAIIASAGRPIMRLFEKIKIRKKPLPPSLRAAMVLVVMISVITLLAAILTPSIASQANSIAEIDLEEVSIQLDQKLDPIEKMLHERNMIVEDHDFKDAIQNNMVKVVKGINLNSIFSNIIGLTGDLFMSAFALLFMSFFFLQDEKLFTWIVFLFVSKRNHKRVNMIMEKVRKTLSRYFFGLMIEVSSMMVLLSIGGFAIGLENAILIGFIGGLLNVIPYLGPLIGAMIGATLVVVGNISLGIDSTLLLAGQIMIVFAIANLIDNFILQPLIYSQSVHMHPLAIFVFIFAGGILGGPIGMILAIPLITVMRIIIGEFFGDDPLVEKLTSGI